MLRMVLDTNVLVSAIIAKGKPRDLLRLAIQRRYLLIKSKETIEEFVEVLQRPKFKMTKKEVVKAKNVLTKKGKTTCRIHRRSHWHERIPYRFSTGNNWWDTSISQKVKPRYSHSVRRRSLYQ